MQRHHHECIHLTSASLDRSQLASPCATFAVVAEGYFKGQKHKRDNKWNAGKRDGGATAAPTPCRNDSGRRKRVHKVAAASTSDDKLVSGRGTC
jgi:hypothetical protein